jgi:salicylate hydroxylase
VPPNCTKILNEWGLQSELAKVATRVQASSFMDLETGEKKGYLEWKEDVIQETGADFLLMAYDDLHRMLYRLATSSCRVKVTSNTSVTTVSIDEKSRLPHAVLANGDILEADVIVGADGYMSVVRADVTDQEYEGRSTGMSVWTVTIPAETIKSEPLIADLIDAPEWPVWMGNSCSVLGANSSELNHTPVLIKLYI